MRRCGVLLDEDPARGKFRHQRQCCLGRKLFGSILPVLFGQLFASGETLTKLQPFVVKKLLTPVC